MADNADTDDRPTASEWRVRLGEPTPRDANSVWTILAESFAAYADEISEECLAAIVGDEQRALERLDGGVKACYIAEAKSADGDWEAIGTLSWDSRDNGMQGWLISMGVRPAWHGSGVAAKLLRVVETQAAAAWHTCMGMGSVSALHRAHRFYRKHGYESVYEAEWNGENAFVFHKDLTYTVREAELDDVAGILSTMRDAFADFEGVYPEDAFEATVMNEEEARARVENMTMYVAVSQEPSKPGEDGAGYQRPPEMEVVGTAGWHWVAGAAEKEAHIRGVGSRRAVHGTGVALALMARLEDDARAQGAEVISLETNVAAERAIAFYERLGYRRSGREQEWHGVTIFDMRKTVAAPFLCP